MEPDFFFARLACVGIVSMMIAPQMPMSQRSPDAMKLTLKTHVRSNPEHVWEKFDRKLFLRLAPPLPRIKLLRFDGCGKGDLVEVELNFLLFKQIWVSEIVHQKTKPNEIMFVDEGVRLPFFLKYWIHKHRIVRLDSGSQIVDDIEFRSGYRIVDWLLWPVMWLQFAYRKPIYRWTFRKRAP